MATPLVHQGNSLFLNRIQGMPCKCSVSITPRHPLVTLEGLLMAPSPDWSVQRVLATSFGVSLGWFMSLFPVNVPLTVFDHAEEKTSPFTL